MKRGPYAVLSLIGFFLPWVIGWGILEAAGFGGPIGIEKGLPLGMVVMAITLITHFAATGIVMVRRANDCGKDRGLAALLLLPVANLAVVIYLMFPPSMEKPIER